MTAVSLEPCGVIRVARAREKERIVAGTEDEKIGELLAEALGLKRRDNREQE